MASQLKPGGRVINWNSILGLLLWFTDDNTEASLVEENQNALEGLDAMFGQVG